MLVFLKIVIVAKVEWARTFRAAEETFVGSFFESRIVLLEVDFTIWAVVHFRFPFCCCPADFAAGQSVYKTLLNVTLIPRIR